MKPQNIKVTRLYATEDGHTHFEDIEVPMLFPIGGKQKVSQTLGPAKFFEFESDFALEWHSAIKRAYYIYVQGKQVVEVSDGEKRSFSAGDVILAEDLTGKGHRSWSVSDVPGRAVIIEI